MTARPQFQRALLDFKSSAHFAPVMEFLRHQSYAGRSAFAEGNYDIHRAASIDGRQQLFMALEDQIHAAEQAALATDA